MIKKFFKLSLIFLLFIPYLTQGKTFFAENYVRENYSEVNTKFNDFENSLPLSNILHNFEIRNSFVLNNTYPMEVLNIEEKEQKPKKPPLDAGKIAGQIIAGYIGGFLGTIAGALLVGITLGPITGEEDIGIAGGLLAFPLGCAYFVYWTGETEEITASFKATLFYSYLGIITFSPFSATIAFNLTRRYKTPPASETGLINFNNSEMSLNIPTIKIIPDPFNEGKLYQNIDLVIVRF